MANLDSQAKRMSGINHGSPWRGILPITGASIDQNDRQHLAFMYSGILSSEATVSSGGIPPVYSVQPLRALSVGRV